MKTPCAICQAPLVHREGMFYRACRNCGALFDHDTLTAREESNDRDSALRDYLSKHACRCEGMLRAASECGLCGARFAIDARIPMSVPGQGDADG